MKKEYYKGIMAGLVIGTIVWCTLWIVVIEKMKEVHKQELNYIIEKHQTK